MKLFALFVGAISAMAAPKAGRGKFPTKIPPFWR